MKTRKFIEIIGSAALIGALAVTGCSVVRAAELDEADESAVEIEETESDETDIEESENQDAFGEEEIYGCCWGDYEFVSTNGELDGQLDYMTLYPNFERSMLQVLSVIPSTCSMTVSLLIAKQPIHMHMLQYTG